MLTKVLTGAFAIATMMSNAHCEFHGFESVKELDGCPYQELQDAPKCVCLNLNGEFKERSCDEGCIGGTPMWEAKPPLRIFVPMDCGHFPGAKLWGDKKVEKPEGDNLFDGPHRVILQDAPKCVCLYPNRKFKERSCDEGCIGGKPMYEATPLSRIFSTMSDGLFPVDLPLDVEVNDENDENDEDE